MPLVQAPVQAKRPKANDGMPEVCWRHDRGRMKIKDPTRFKVRAKRCDQCPFSRNQRIVSSRRLAGIKRTLRRTNNPFMCHKTLADDLVCRGFFDTEANLVVALARMLEVIEYVKVGR